MTDSDLSCQQERRRDDVRQAPLFGLDYVEVSDDQLTLEVFFLGKAPPQLEKANVRITGGRRILNIGVTDLRVHRVPDPAFDDYLEVHLNKYGDFSTYTLSLVKLDDKRRPTHNPMDGFDPRYDSVDFTFKAGCPTDLDCKPQQACPPPQREQPEINYLAKDYASFRQLILDRLAVIMPDWQETHLPDIGIMLVELLAYIGDYLSYFQDAVATEAYLATARQRISVRRHARLVDYTMHEGCNARAWLTIKSSLDCLDTVYPRQILFATNLPVITDSHVLQPNDWARVPAGDYELFEPLVEDPAKPIQIYADHSEILFYGWGDRECCLAPNSTAATLTDRWVPAQESPPPGPIAGEPPGMVRALHLQAGDVLIFEEVIGPATGNGADADPKHRQAVRLTKVTPAIDPLYHPFSADYGQPVVEIEWCSEDVLTFPLCISARMPAPDCSYKENISVARGNVVLVDNGLTVAEGLGTVVTLQSSETCPSDCDPGVVVSTPARLCPVLKQAPLTFTEPLPACGCAGELVLQDPRQALPAISLEGTKDGVVTVWSAKSDLLESSSSDPDFVVEIDDDGNAHLRFGNGDEGRMPDAGIVFEASYRVGNGPSGNVGAETITYLVFREPTAGVGDLVPRNPMAAAGGTAPEPLTEVKLFAPYAFRDVLERAITGDDYAALAADNDRRLAERPALLAAITGNTVAESLPGPGADDPRAAEEEEPGETTPLRPDICLIPFRRLQGAKGTLRWTGSWYRAQVAVDPLGTEQADAELCAEIDAYLEPYRRIGHDLSVNGADYVPLDLALSVCVMPDYLRGHVESALVAVLGNSVLPDGTLGFFNPDNLTFGEGIFVSRIVAVAQAVPGVMDAEVTRLERYEIGEPPPGVEKTSDELPAGGVLKLGPFQIPRLDNDPNFPENGRLTLDIRGGR